MVLKTVSGVMADWNVVSNLEFLCCFAQALVFFMLKISMNVPFFTHLALLDLKLKHHFMRKFLSWGLEKRRLKV